MKFLLCVFAFLCAYVLSEPRIVKPGSIWRDSSGRIIQSHGGGFIQVGKEWFWFGEDKTKGSLFQNISCYSSTDLVNWKFRSNAVTLQESGDLGPSRIVERPKVLYNEHTKQYVMYMHIDSTNYAEAKVGVSISKTVVGPYSYLGSFRPLNHQSRDMTIFKDDDGVGYLLFEDRERGISIAKLTSDYLKVESELHLIQEHYECPTIVKVDGLYYLLGSKLTGWSTNDNVYSTSRSLSGPWSPFTNVAPIGTKTFDSQSTFIVTLHGSEVTSYIYIGDRWNPDNLSDSRYMWMPLYVSNGTMKINSDKQWKVDAVTGSIQQ
ncbi:xylan 1,3-beta-xylosidase [Acrasis kona]|uniref:Xylan 1,3-beta-xylosidase n=1 Tax=Acrasis kona TaxID=1008807 RepID=A0AAW2Z4M9_9EUKA